MHKTYPLKKCPWCGHDPKFSMYLAYDMCNACYIREERRKPDEKETWLPHIRCENPYCPVQPKSKYVPIRNTSKIIESEFWKRLDKAIDNWDLMNPSSATIGIYIDFSDTIKQFNNED